jgi:S1-C subfamily serine protease
VLDGLNQMMEEPMEKPMDEPDARPDETPDPTPHPHDNPARHGAPLPPPPPPPAPSSPSAPSAASSWVYPPVPPTSYAAPPPPHRSHRLRLVAAGTALVVVAVAGGLGFAMGRWHHGSQPAAGGGRSFSAPNGEGRTPFGDGGTSPFGGTPFSGPGEQEGSPFGSSADRTPASTDQLTGLVRVAATLKYQGGKAAGTGMVVTRSGEVITNHHVVEGATRIQVKVMSTGQSYRASVIGTDAKDDVALLQLKNAAGLTTVATDTSPVSVGDAVTAVGDAGGSTSTFSAAAGKVTDTSRRITTHSQDGHSSEKLRGLIEISSDVISGDSGGATYDDQGEVVGMTTAASSGSSDVVGYAIPIAKVLRIADDLEQGTQNARYEYGAPAFLGLGLQGSGTTVSGVYPGTPAARAGVTAGDTVTRVGSTRVTTATALKSAITTYSPGDRVRIVWADADGTSHIATVRLMSGPVA